VKIVLLDEAKHRFETEDSWWRRYRDATELFVTEFEEALRHLDGAPAVGQRYRRVGGKLIQRLLMPKTRCHIYYFHDVERRYRNSFDPGARRRLGPRL
jgi:hypothetical protein